MLKGILNAFKVPKKPPNFLILLTDDQRWDTLGCMDNPIIQTGNLDALARRGVLFTNAFVTTPICSSSRASILSGLHTRCHGVVDFDTPLPPDLLDMSYPVLLRESGYRNGFIGKWGLGGELPHDHFDSFEGFKGQGDYFPDGEQNGPHLTSILTDQGIRFIESHDTDQPFCLSISFKAPHGQSGDDRKFVHDHVFDDLYEADTFPEPRKASEEDYNALPSFFQHAAQRKAWKDVWSTPEIYQEMVRRYYRLITGVDVAVGRLLNALEQHGLADNTVVLFSSDHGFFLGERQLIGKWLMYEEAIRVPLIVFDPRQTHRQKSRVREQMVLNIDIAPTLLDLAGVPAPRFMTGRSMLPLLESGTASWREEAFFEHHHRKKGEIPASEAVRIDNVRTDRWKYIRYIDEDPVVEELYDLGADPEEVRNLAADPAFQDDVERLRSRWRRWSEALGEWRAGSEYTWRDPD